MAGSDHVRAWQPRVAGVAEVLHAEWREHAYPAHTHDTWTLLIVDDGLIGYELAGHERAATRSGVTLLPPHVVHDGRPVTSRGFRKRVMYLDEQTLGRQYIGAAADRPLITDPALRLQVSRLDRALSRHDDLEAESRLAVVVELLTRHLSGGAAPRLRPAPGQVASPAREIFDADPVGMRSVADVAAALGVSTAHLVRAFAGSYGIPRHRYVLGPPAGSGAAPPARRRRRGPGGIRYRVLRPGAPLPALQAAVVHHARPLPTHEDDVPDSFDEHARRRYRESFTRINNVQDAGARISDRGPMDDPLSLPFTTKLAVLVRDDPESWQRLNVTAFLTSGITAANPQLIGGAYADADGQQNLPLLGMPILVVEGSATDLRVARDRALGRGLPLAIYTRDGFATRHDFCQPCRRRLGARHRTRPCRYRCKWCQELGRKDRQEPPAPVTGRAPLYNSKRSPRQRG